MKIAKKATLVFLIFLIVKFDLFALDTLTIKYFPLHVGDYWIYNCHSWSSFNDTTYRVKAVVVQSCIKENHTYYLILNHPVYNNNNLYLRVDSITGGLLRYDSTNSCSYYFREDLVDSLSASPNQYIYFCHYNSIRKFCAQIDTLSIFGQTNERKKFNWGFFIGSHSTIFNSYFTKNFGLTDYSVDDIYTFSSHYTVTLIGCRINQFIYGDTSLIPVISISNIIPDKSILFQNYPNPFNPVTIIKYQVKDFRLIKIMVYNILGEEIKTIINEKQKPDTYEVTFNSSNLPSGVYYYSLFVDGIRIDTKKMIIIK
jgi:hypothetical protein